MNVPNAVLRCGSCLSSPEEQAEWEALINKQFGGADDDDLARTERCSEIILARHSIDRSKRTFDFKIVTASNSISSRIEHVNDMSELSEVLGSKSCGCELYSGGCAKAVKAFLGVDWDVRIREQRMKRYMGRTPTHIAKADLKCNITACTTGGLFLTMLPSKWRTWAADLPRCLALPLPHSPTVLSSCSCGNEQSKCH